MPLEIGPHLTDVGRLFVEYAPPDLFGIETDPVFDQSFSALVQESLPLWSRGKLTELPVQVHRKSLDFLLEQLPAIVANQPCVGVVFGEEVYEGTVARVGGNDEVADLVQGEIPQRFILLAQLVDLRSAKKREKRGYFDRKGKWGKGFYQHDGFVDGVWFADLVSFAVVVIADELDCWFPFHAVDLVVALGHPDVVLCAPEDYVTDAFVCVGICLSAAASVTRALPYLYK